MNEEKIDLSVTLGKIKLRNPVIPASGTFGYGSEFSDFLNIDDLGAIVVKGTTLHPDLGSFQHRFAEVAGCVKVSTIGLQNVGVDHFITAKLPYLRRFTTPVIVNIAGKTIAEFIKITEILNDVQGLSGIEINLACPNVHKGGAHFCANPETTFEVVKSVRNSTDLTIIPKLTPGMTSIKVLAKACEEAGADAICPNYGVAGMVIDIDTRRSALGRNLTGGVGGPWKKPIAVKMVWETAQVVHIPIIGVGGVTCAEDALEFFIAGATAVEIGLYNLIDPDVTIKTIEGIKRYFTDHGIRKMDDIIGSFVHPSD